MSAFIVTDQTISKIITALGYRNQDFARRQIKESGGWDLSKASGRQAFGQALLAMNFQAVNARYREETLTRHYHASIEACSLIQSIKAAECLQYQCAEGDVPDTELFKLLDKIVHWLSSEFVHSSQEYQNAKWA